MNTALYCAAALAFLVGVAHSILGEHYILQRLFRRTDLPKLFGGNEFTIRTLRFAWHITSIAWWGFATILILMAQDNVSKSTIGWSVGVTFFASALITLTASRGKHLAWIVFLIIGCIAIISTYQNIA